VKKKANRNNRDIELDYVRHPIKSTAVEFKFTKGLSIVAIRMPSIGTVVIGKDTKNPSRCWTYPSEISMKEAVSKTFKAILDAACKKFEGLEWKKT
jgi:hypothetical protein